MWVVRQQFAVGQGCFHAGAIGLGNRIGDGTSQFRYVYDCGSNHQRALRETIDLYKQRASSIDALFVSHLDDDHVSGLDRLLAAVKVDTVYIPYVDDTVLVLDLIEAEEDGVFSGSLIEASIEPELWFGRRGVRRVVRIAGNESPPPDGPAIPGIPPEGPTVEDGPLTFKEYPYAPRRLRKGKADVQSELLEMMPGSSIQILTGGRPLDWLLLPYVHPAPKERRAAFRRAMRKALRLKPRQRVTAARLAQALRDPAEREQLRDSYDEIIAGGVRRMHNRTSMSLYSGPTGRSVGKPWELRILAGRPIGLSDWWPEIDTVGWIGAGDATLNVKNVRTAWQEFYRPLELQLATLLLPHHGSRHNFHPELLDGANLKFCVASAGKPSRYKHPSPNVIDEIRLRGKGFWHVSQRDGSSLVELIRSV